MAVILRLQGLNIEAGPGDIRRFFHGLHMPEGCVHIIGGKLGEAFIIFTSERDGQLAIRRSGKLLRGSPVTLNLSSFAELKHKMLLHLKKKRCSKRDPVARKAVPLSVETHDEHRMGPEESRARKPGYLRLYGLPNAVTTQDVCRFLGGVSVLDVVVNVLQGRDQCCLVKVASVEEAEKGLKYSCRTLLGSCIRVKLAHEMMWTSAMEDRKNPQSPTSAQESASPDLHSYHSIPDKRGPEDQSMAGSPKRHCSEDGVLSGSPRHHHSGTMVLAPEYCIMVQNLPKNITKTEIRRLFSCPDIPSNKILHLLNKWKERTSTAFMVFSQAEDYDIAINMDGCLLGTKHISVSSVTKEKMRDMLQNSRFAEPEKFPLSGSWTALSCIYVRNFPADVKKTEVRDLFGGYRVCERNITLLEDDDGHGIGEALVQLPCEQSAQDARQALNGKNFLGVRVLLTCISPRQMKAILDKV